MKLLVKNIALIVGIDTQNRERICNGDMNNVDMCRDAWLTAENGRITGFGSIHEEKQPDEKDFDQVVDAKGGMLYPSFCDSHTHIVYAGSREREFLDKIHGLSYEEIARNGGGILNSAALLRDTSEDELYEQAMERAREIARMGTGAVEIKSASSFSDISQYSRTASTSGNWCRRNQKWIRTLN